MRAWLLSLYLIILSVDVHAQFLKLQLEPMIGFHFYKSIRKTHEYNQVKGLTNTVGLKSSLTFGDYGSLNFTRGIHSIQYPDLFAQLTARVHLYHPKSYLTLFVEGGAEISEFDDFQTPFYIGVINSEGDIFSWVTRIRIPTGLDTHLFKTTSEFHFGMELGLQINLMHNRKPPPLQRFGNPFILY